MSSNSNKSPSENIEILVQSLLKNPKKIFKGLFYVRLLVGVLLIGISLFIGTTPLLLLIRGVKTKGEIVRYETVNWVSRDENGTLVFHSPSIPVVEFSLNEQKIQFQDHFGTNSSAGVQSEVTVLYDPRHPRAAMIERKFLNWIPWAPLFLTGLLLLFT